MGFWSSVTSYFSGTDSGDDVCILPPSGGSPGGIDSRDLVEIDQEISADMLEPGEVDVDEYARVFQVRSQERRDYRALSMEILLEMEKDVDFAAEYALRFEEKLEERIEYLNSDGYDRWRIHRYNFVEPPEEDLRTELGSTENDITLPESN